MKLINERKQAVIRYRLEVAVAAIMAPIIVTITAVTTSPLAFGVFEQGLV